MKKIGLNQPSADHRGKAMAMISSWVHEEDKFPNEVMERSPAALRIAEGVSSVKKVNQSDINELLDKYEESLMIGKQLSLIASALIHCWADCAGIPSHILLGDIAITQALDPE